MATYYVNLGISTSSATGSSSDPFGWNQFQTAIQTGSNTYYCKGYHEFAAGGPATLYLNNGTTNTIESWDTDIARMLFNHLSFAISTQSNATLNLKRLILESTSGAIIGVTGTLRVSIYLENSVFVGNGQYIVSISQSPVGGTFSAKGCSFINKGEISTSSLMSIGAASSQSANIDSCYFEGKCTTVFSTSNVTGSYKYCGFYNLTGITSIGFTDGGNNIGQGFTSFPIGTVLPTQFSGIATTTTTFSKTTVKFGNPIVRTATRFYHDLDTDEQLIDLTDTSGLSAGMILISRDNDSPGVYPILTVYSNRVGVDNPDGFADEEIEVSVSIGALSPYIYLTDVTNIRVGSVITTITGTDFNGFQVNDVPIIFSPTRPPFVVTAVDVGTGKLSVDPAVIKAETISVSITIKNSDLLLLSLPSAITPSSGSPLINTGDPSLGLATDIFNTLRSSIPDIGPVELESTPRISYFSQGSVADGTMVTSYINRDELVTAIQADSSDTYFDTTDEINKVLVYYRDPGYRQNVMIIHEGAVPSGLVSWNSGARDGTWEKYRVIAIDSNGARHRLERTAIGTSEDITHSGGSMNLNT